MLAQIVSKSKRIEIEHNMPVARRFYISCIRELWWDFYVEIEGNTIGATEYEKTIQTGHLPPTP